MIGCSLLDGNIADGATVIIAALATSTMALRVLVMLTVTAILTMSAIMDRQ